MTVTLLDIIRAAAGRGAVVTADTAGYLVLAVLDRLVLVPSEPSADGICLLEDGSVHLGDSRPTDPAHAEAAARVALRTLLAVASGGTSALARVAQRPTSGALAPLMGEIEAALIPLNRAAGRRALARLHREVTRAKDRGQLAAPPASRVALATGAAADVGEVSEPIELDVHVDVDPTEIPIDVEPAEPASPFEVATVGKGSVAVWSIDATQRVPDVAPIDEPSSEIVPAVAPAEPESRCWEAVAPERTPLLGTLAAGDDAEPQPPSNPTAAPPAPSPFRSAQHTPPLPPPTLNSEPVVRSSLARPFALNQREHTPPLPPPNFAQEAVLVSDAGTEAHVEAADEGRGESVEEQEIGSQPQVTWVPEEDAGPTHVVAEPDAADVVPVQGGVLTQTEQECAAEEQNAAIDDALLEEVSASVSAVPVAANVIPSAALLQDLEPCYAPRRSDVRELLAAFRVAETRTEEDLSRELKALAGIDVTPPPVAVSDEATPGATPAAKRAPKDQRWRIGIVSVAGVLVLGALLRTGGAVVGFGTSGDIACEATLVLKSATPGSELRVRALGVDEPWLSRVADAPTVEMGGLTCSRPHEIVIRGAEGWQRFEVKADEVAPEPGQNAVRHELALR